MFHRTGLVRLAIVGVLVAVMAGSTALWVQQRPQQIAKAQPQLHVDPAALDLGEVWEDRAFVWTLPVSNRSERSLTLQEVRAGCRCLTVEPKQLPLAPGETQSIQLTIDLRVSMGQADKDGTTFSRSFELAMAPELADLPSAHPLWVLRGRVRRALTLSPPEISLPDLIRGQTPSEQTIQLLPHVALRRLETQCDPSQATVQVVEQTDGSRNLKVQLTPAMKAGPLDVEVQVKPVLQDGQTIPPAHLKISGVIKEDVQSSPAVVSLGVLKRGSTAEETISLRSVTGAPFKVQSVESTSSDVIPLEDSQQGSNVYRISIRCSATGHQSAVIRFQIVSQVPRAEQVTVEVPVNWYGIE